MLGGRSRRQMWEQQSRVLQWSDQPHRSPPSPAPSFSRRLFQEQRLQRGTGKPPPFSRRPPLPLDPEGSRGLREAPPTTWRACPGGERTGLSLCASPGGRCAVPRRREGDAPLRGGAASRRDAAAGLGSAAQGGRPPASSSRWLGGAGEGEELRPPPPHPPARAPWPSSSPSLAETAPAALLHSPRLAALHSTSPRRHPLVAEGELRRAPSLLAGSRPRAPAAAGGGAG
jgi:hypothetical protein